MVPLSASFLSIYPKKLLYVHGDTQICNSKNQCLFEDDEIKNLLQENNFKPSIETNRIDAVLSFDPCESWSIAKEEHWRYFPIFEVPLRPLLDCTPQQLGIAHYRIQPQFYPVIRLDVDQFSMNKQQMFIKLSHRSKNYR